MAIRRPQRECDFTKKKKKDNSKAYTEFLIILCRALGLVSSGNRLKLCQIYPALRLKVQQPRLMRVSLAHRQHSCTRTYWPAKNCMRSHSFVVIVSGHSEKLLKNKCRFFFFKRCSQITFLSIVHFFYPRPPNR